MSDMNMATLLLNQECPFNNQCKSLDCIECAEIYKEAKEDGN